MKQVKKDLVQFSTYNPHINLSFHQYLLLTDEPILFHTGNTMQATDLVPQLKEALDGKELKYIFVSHFEADECGGLAVILENFPSAKTICSEVTSRQLSGFGYKNEVLIKRSGEKLTASSFELEFISYPSEMHLWEGILVIENHRNIFFSSDLMIRFGEANGTIINSNWGTEVNNIDKDQVPDTDKLNQLKDSLARLNPKFIATGHGPCIDLK